MFIQCNTNAIDPSDDAIYIDFVFCWFFLGREGENYIASKSKFKVYVLLSNTKVHVLYIIKIKGVVLSKCITNVKNKKTKSTTKNKQKTTNKQKHFKNIFSDLISSRNHF